MHKDIFGRVIEVGDVIGWSIGGGGINVDVVTQILPKTVKISNAGSVYGSTAVILNEQMEASGQGEKLQTLRERYKEHFVYTKPKQPSAKTAYVLMLISDPNTNEIFLRTEKFHWEEKREINNQFNEAVKQLTESGFAVRISRNGGYNDIQFIYEDGGIYKVSRGYRFDPIVARLTDVKALNLQDWIGKNLPYEQFKSMVGSKFDGTDLVIK